MTAGIDKLYIGKLDKKVDKKKKHISQNNKNKACHCYVKHLKIKSANVKSSTYLDFDIENSDKDPKDPKDSFPNWSEVAFEIKEVKNTVLWTYVTSDPNSRKCWKKSCQQQSKQSL